HSVNKLSLAQEINKRAQQVNRIVNVLLEINIYGEESKQGYSLEELEIDIEELKKLENIKIIGLMTMAPLEVEENITRKVFSKLAEIKRELNKKFFNGSLLELSMGMSGDYKIALEEGSTIIRVGSKLFE
ncbi:MAG: YggS family pyridoxal phosphate-dependent enzyme, partial [Fusobacterium sp.]|nr:YggS family pyridoxal phosphate-dependent enzyme [Fusobacterium sp.]